MCSDGGCPGVHVTPTRSPYPPTSTTSFRNVLISGRRFNFHPGHDWNCARANAPSPAVPRATRASATHAATTRAATTRRAGRRRVVVRVLVAVDVIAERATRDVASSHRRDVDVPQTLERVLSASASRHRATRTRGAMMRATTTTTTCATTTTTTTTRAKTRATTRATRRAHVARANASPDGDASKGACSGSCDSCGLAKEKMQCDGSGRIQGGMGAIPLFAWWPIKAYRPCPGLIDNGGVYTRKGQDVNAILWGESGKD